MKPTTISLIKQHRLSRSELELVIDNQNHQLYNPANSTSIFHKEEDDDDQFRGASSRDVYHNK